MPGMGREAKSDTACRWLSVPGGALSGLGRGVIRSPAYGYGAPICPLPYIHSHTQERIACHRGNGD